MDNDILREYFTKVEKPLTQEDFERRLIDSLHKRIVRIEYRKYIVTRLLVVVGILAAIAALIYFTPLETLQKAIPSFEMEISPTSVMLVVQVSTLALLSLIYQYCTYECQLRKLRERVKRKAQ